MRIRPQATRTIPSTPLGRCAVCGSRRYWWREQRAGWTCGGCVPPTDVSLALFWYDVPWTENEIAAYVEAQAALARSLAGAPLDVRQREAESLRAALIVRDVRYGDRFAETAPAVPSPDAVH